MHSLVTGASGFLGGALVAKLLGRGDEVVGRTVRHGLRYSVGWGTGRGEALPAFPHDS